MLLLLLLLLHSRQVKLEKVALREKEELNANWGQILRAAKAERVDLEARASALRGRCAVLKERRRRVQQEVDRTRAQLFNTMENGRCVCVSGGGVVCVCVGVFVRARALVRPACVSSAPSPHRGHDKTDASYARLKGCWRTRRPFTPSILVVRCARDPSSLCVGALSGCLDTNRPRVDPSGGSGGGGGDNGHDGALRAARRALDDHEASVKRAESRRTSVAISVSRTEAEVEERRSQAAGANAAVDEVET